MSLAKGKIENISYWKERVDLAATIIIKKKIELHNGVEKQI